MPQCCSTFLEFSMSQPERRQIEQAIQTYIDPYLHKSLLELKAVRNIRIEGSRVEMEIRLGYPADSLKGAIRQIDRKSTRLNSSHVKISYAVFCLKKKNRRRNGERLEIRSLR